MDSSLAPLLGLARKAGKVQAGEEAVAATANAHKARLILVASDAGGSTLRKAQTLGESGNCPVCPAPLTKEELGRAVGRGSCAVLAVTDVGLAAQAAKRLAQQDPDACGDAAQALERKAEKALRRKRQKKNQ